MKIASLTNDEIVLNDGYISFKEVLILFLKFIFINFLSFIYDFFY